MSQQPQTTTPIRKVVKKVVVRSKGDISAADASKTVAPKAEIDPSIPLGHYTTAEKENLYLFSTNYALDAKGNLAFLHECVSSIPILAIAFSQDFIIIAHSAIPPKSTPNSTCLSTYPRNPFTNELTKTCPPVSRYSINMRDISKIAIHQTAAFLHLILSNPSTSAFTSFPLPNLPPLSGSNAQINPETAIFDPIEPLNLNPTPLIFQFHPAPPTASLDSPDLHSDPQLATDANQPTNPLALSTSPLPINSTNTVSTLTLPIPSTTILCILSGTACGRLWARFVQPFHGTPSPTPKRDQFASSEYILLQLIQLTQFESHIAQISPLPPTSQLLNPADLIITTKERTYVLSLNLSALIQHFPPSPALSPQSTFPLNTPPPHFLTIYPVGSQIRHDYMGVCALPKSLTTPPTSTDSTNSPPSALSFLCSRPGRRLWIAEAAPTNTIKQKEETETATSPGKTEKGRNQLQVAVKSTLKLTMPLFSTLPLSYFTTIPAPINHTLTFSTTNTQEPLPLLNSNFNTTTLPTTKGQLANPSAPPAYVISSANMPLHFHELYSSSALIIGVTHGIGFNLDPNRPSTDAATTQSQSTSANHDDTSKPNPSQTNQSGYDGTCSVLCVIDVNKVIVTEMISFGLIHDVSVHNTSIMILHSAEPYISPQTTNQPNTTPILSVLSYLPSKLFMANVKAFMIGPLSCTLPRQIKPADLDLIKITDILLQHRILYPQVALSYASRQPIDLHAIQQIKQLTFQSHFLNSAGSSEKKDKNDRTEYHLCPHSSQLPNLNLIASCEAPSVPSLQLAITSQFQLIYQPASNPFYQHLQEVQKRILVIEHQFEQKHSEMCNMAFSSDAQSLQTSLQTDIDELAMLSKYTHVYTKLKTVAGNLIDFAVASKNFSTLLSIQEKLVSKFKTLFEELGKKCEQLKLDEQQAIEDEKKRIEAEMIRLENERKQQDEEGKKRKKAEERAAKQEKLKQLKIQQELELKKQRDEELADKARKEAEMKAAYEAKLIEEAAERERLKKLDEEEEEEVERVKKEQAEIEKRRAADEAATELKRQADEAKRLADEQAAAEALVIKKEQELAARKKTEADAAEFKRQKAAEKAKGIEDEKAEKLQNQSSSQIATAVSVALGVKPGETANAVTRQTSLPATSLQPQSSSTPASTNSVDPYSSHLSPELFVDYAHENLAEYEEKVTKKFRKSKKIKIATILGSDDFADVISDRQYKMSIDDQNDMFMAGHDDGVLDKGKKSATTKGKKVKKDVIFSAKIDTIVQELNSNMIQDAGHDGTLGISKHDKIDPVVKAHFDSKQHIETSKQQRVELPSQYSTILLNDPVSSLDVMTFSNPRPLSSLLQFSTVSVSDTIDQPEQLQSVVILPPSSLNLIEFIIKSHRECTSSQQVPSTSTTLISHECSLLETIALHSSISTSSNLTSKSRIIPSIHHQQRSHNSPSRTLLTSLLSHLFEALHGLCISYNITSIPTDNTQPSSSPSLSETLTTTDEINHNLTSIQQINAAALNSPTDYLPIINMMLTSLLSDPCFNVNASNKQSDTTAESERSHNHFLSSNPTTITTALNIVTSQLSQSNTFADLLNSSPPTVAPAGRSEIHTYHETTAILLPYLSTVLLNQTFRDQIQHISAFTQYVSFYFSTLLLNPASPQSTHHSHTLSNQRGPDAMFKDVLKLTTRPSSLSSQPSQNQSAMLLVSYWFEQLTQTIAHLSYFPTQQDQTTTGFVKTDQKRVFYQHLFMILHTISQTYIPQFLSTVSHLVANNSLESSPDFTPYLSTFAPFIYSTINLTVMLAQTHPSNTLIFSHPLSGHNALATTSPHTPLSHYFTSSTSSLSPHLNSQKDHPIVQLSTFFSLFNIDIKPNRIKHLFISTEARSISTLLVPALQFNTPFLDEITTDSNFNKLLQLSAEPLSTPPPSSTPTPPPTNSLFTFIAQLLAACLFKAHQFDLCTELFYAFAMNQQLTTPQSTSPPLTQPPTLNPSSLISTQLFILLHLQAMLFIDTIHSSHQITSLHSVPSYQLIPLTTQSFLHTLHTLQHNLDETVFPVTITQPMVSSLYQLISPFINPSLLTLPPPHAPIPSLVQTRKFVQAAHHLIDLFVPPFAPNQTFNEISIPHLFSLSQPQLSQQQQQQQRSMDKLSSPSFDAINAIIMAEQNQHTQTHILQYGPTSAEISK